MKSIPGYETLYSITDDLNVFSAVSNRYLKPSKMTSGYYVVNLWKDGKFKTHYMHRLVAEAFIPNPENLPIINHKDKDRGNNSISNLEWCDSQYNNEYSQSKHYTFEHEQYGIVSVFNLSKFCRQYNLDCGCMVRVSKGERNKHKGWTTPKSSEDISLFPTEDVPSNSLREI